MPESMSSWGDPKAPAARIDLALGPRDLLAPAAVAEAHPDGRSAVEGQADDVRAGHDLEVGAAEGGAQVGVGRAPAPPVALGDLGQARAVLLGPVVVRHDRHPRGRGGLQERARQGPRGPLVGDVQRPADRVVLGRAALVVLGAQEVGAHVLPAPAGGAPGLPQVVVQRPPADVEHRVHRRRAAQALARGARRASARRSGPRARSPGPSRAWSGTAWRRPRGSSRWGGGPCRRPPAAAPACRGPRSGGAPGRNRPSRRPR